MANSTYSEKLRDPRWQKRRLEILARDKFTCTLCGDTETELHVHHKYYTSHASPWQYEDDALTTHCKHCHQCAEQLKQDDVTVVISAKRSHGEGKYVTISGIYKNTSGGKGLFICLYYCDNNHCEVVTVSSPETSQQIKTLIELSEKL